MEVCDVTLRHNGNMLTTVRKLGVTVPEIAVLQYVHGPDAVHGIQVRRTIRRQATTEIERLMALYDADAEHGHPVDVLWPGHGAQKALPKTLADIGITKDSPFFGFDERAVPDENPANYHTMSQDGDDEGEEDDAPEGAPDEPAAGDVAAGVLKGAKAGKGAQTGA